VDVFEMLRQASIFALLCLTVPVVPLVMALVYAIRPTEARLAMIRPLSLAAIFASISGASLGAINVLRFSATSDLPLTSQAGLIGLAEAMVTLFTGFGCLTVAWLCVAIGLRRQM
jgi:hypothetical protein